MFPLLALSLLAAPPAAAQQGRVDLSATAGWFFSPQEVQNQVNVAIVPRLGYNFADQWAVEADIGFSTGLSDSLDYRYSSFSPRINAVFNPWPDAEIQAFFAAGPGYLRETQASVNDPEDVNTASGFLLNIGPGVRIPIQDFLALRFDFRWFADLNTGEDGATGAYEGTAGLNFFFGGGPKDADADGLPDDVDECVDEPEDVDGFNDADGCPDLDNDEDGVTDSEDGCPVDAEDIDEFEDEDGCPDPDNDDDTLADAEDACPVDAGPVETKGCPDKDGDLVPDSRDRCPEKARNPDIPPEKSTGCPRQKVVLGDKKIEIKEKVFFETGSAKIAADSHDLLDQMAEVFGENESIRKVRVEGHTDNVGNAGANKTLSKERAEAVVAYLVDKGVDAGRLVAKGFGDEQPIADNDSEEGRSDNRRVEFVIVDRAAGKKGDKKDGKKGGE